MLTGLWSSLLLLLLDVGRTSGQDVACGLPYSRLEHSKTFTTVGGTVVVTDVAPAKEAALTCDEGFVPDSATTTSDSPDGGTTYCWPSPLPHCSPTANRALDLGAMRQLSKDADATQDWWMETKPIFPIVAVWCLTVVCMVGSVCCAKSLVGTRERRERKAREREEDAQAEAERAQEEAMTAEPVYGDNGGQGYSQPTSMAPTSWDHTKETVPLKFSRAKPGKAWDLNM